LGYLPQQLPKSFNNFYFNTFYPQATIAHCPRQVILITNDSPHIQFRSFIQDNSFSDGGIDVIQHFLIDELLFDVMEHNSQAQFFVLSDSEKKDFFEEIGGNEGQIPLMLEHDPIAKYLGLKKGTLIRIIQTFENLPNISPLDVEYRIIV
jgi:DNA-directed RNA polymerase subunit H (RpoH/RPB5)